MKKIGRTLKENWMFLLMVFPGMIWLVLFFYIPVFGNVVAFKNYHLTGNGFIHSLFHSPWVGLDNFRFLFSSRDAYIITRNTVLYNVGFIVLGLIAAVAMAIILSELRSKKLVRIYQTTMLFPHFLSWIIISFFVYAFLSPDKGILNHILAGFGGEGKNWYVIASFWPAFLLFLGIWKGLGNSSIIYYATIMGIDPSYYEAATMDGASKWQRIRHVTIPQLAPLMIILTILAVGNIFRADFGLFYLIPKNSGQIFNVTNVLDTYVYTALARTGDISMAAAAGLYQSIVGFILVLTTNLIVRRIDKDAALF
ncbi:MULTISPECIES: sugar ABC transporter permease [unclassified Streptococcus]|uniref:ABC transporter permease n=1 Tax=unclassified Streptococcus TaxID=2608887 RepID=UPI001071FE7A|nr:MULTISPECIES: sugar ABC transporter permease [unclassified Streptococcus]MBF0787208.1 sugar ABC transporter permease [Streptococcus sp. 19428wC2_LYSM12]MCQ9211894.1 sugar ABC transporter permease [Streptococcus sp. B01]MCQ9212898.1 sugar ABC transporter permease [Streptococcus sp. O1]MCQ9213222.1 sugar ABC transporter permease [Streptococcus sp. O1]TFV05838.1 sugar ABC transporter permease [Streptococcus sp. LYSM12]